MNKLIAFLFLIIFPIFAHAYDSISSLEEYFELIEKVRENNKFAPSEMLICLDFDEVTIAKVENNNDPYVLLEGEKTAQVYSNLLHAGYSVMIVTARNNGQKIDIKEKKQQLIRRAEKINHLLGQNKLSFSHFKGLSEIHIKFDIIEQWGYLTRGILYAGRAKGFMLRGLLHVLEKKSNIKFKALFMVDDQDTYLDTFKNNQGLKEHFNENIHLILFSPLKRSNSIDLFEVFEEEKKIHNNSN